MTEPAKDEAELVDQVALAILDYGVINNTIGALATSALAAIRAAGWAVVPVEPTDEMFEAGHEEVLGGVVELSRLTAPCSQQRRG